ncbi:actin-domain-containing protein [Xylariaceae sp. FL0255]|nr:actin-domain-containing protein [Xylariaceae sp. FL0255]
MSSNTTLPPILTHRTVSSIRGQSATTPQTPSRPISSSFGSPSSLRADDEVIVIELGSRKLRLGFGGDVAPKRIVTFSPEQHRRAGDFRAWDIDFKSDWRKRASGKKWGADYELWQLDTREQDLGLVEDKLERELRDAYFRWLLIDSRPRKVTLVLPPTLPIPLLSSVLDTLFDRFQAPTISLLSSPVMAAVGAGARSSLVIDLGWHETTVTAVYEYREVRSWRTIRAGKFLVEETFEFLSRAIQGRTGTDQTERTEDKLGDDAVSFEECEEVATRMLWCKKAAKKQLDQDSTREGLPTVHEHEDEETPPAEYQSAVDIKLNSCVSPKTVAIPFAQLAEPCETTFFETRLSPSSFDDHELPVHLLIHRALLQLPLDVRAVCMSRIIFTGGCSSIIGLRGRIIDEVSILVEEQGWDPVTGKAAEQVKSKTKAKSNGIQNEQNINGNSLPIPVVVQPASSDGEEDEDTEENTTDQTTNAADTPQEIDQVEEMIKKERDDSEHPVVQGELRVVDSLGPWCGASLATQLRIPALATIDRDLWLQQGVNGASRPSEVDIKNAPQRQSMGPSGLMRGQAAQPGSWTLGIWGSLF